VGGNKKELVFAGTTFLQKRIPGKVHWNKRNMERNSFFLQEHERNSLEFLERGVKKGMKKGMHNLRQCNKQPDKRPKRG
jgi:hypothetical protein